MKTREEIQEELEENERFFAQLQTYVLADPAISAETPLLSKPQPSHHLKLKVKTFPTKCYS